MRNHSTGSGRDRPHRVRRWWWATSLRLRLVPVTALVALAVLGGVSVLMSGSRQPVQAQPPPPPPSTTTTVAPPPPPPEPEPTPLPPEPTTTTPPTTTPPPPPVTTTTEAPPPPRERTVFFGQRCEIQGERARHYDGTPMVCDYLFDTLRFVPE
ncbi:hypothetical protein GIY23_11190 [Allosaccharopolyspora coralli]|uniref:Uncharacterized protein n=1 Tax=Allosaccharopolyspora coralli TaxID=2665642 RepID=A0A5Q3QEX9_9PSEU|nr:hypothetical protein [Allosaccharopolyspora coralli]QGK70009.1 hypothetical protein GIY23_11190 [Allosaccharopolyspora coralli]